MLIFKPIKVGVLGCGTVSGAYLSTCKKFNVLEIAACSDLEMFRAEAKAEQYKIPLILTIDEMLKDKKIQLILNLTHPKVHAKINLQILEAGKSLYSEKPLGLNLAEAHVCLLEAENRCLSIGCAPDTFLDGVWQTARKLLDDGAIGQPLAASAFMGSAGHEHWHPDPESFYQLGGGPMMDVGPYYLTALVSLLGPIARVAGASRAILGERTITSEKKRGQKIPVAVPTHYAGVLDFASGVIGTIITSYDLTAHHLPHLEIYGSKGALSLPDPSAYGEGLKIRLHGASDWEDVALTHPKGLGRGAGVADMAYAMTHKRPHRASGALAYHVLEAMLAFDESSQSGMHVAVHSPCERPAALPTGLASNEFDF